MDVNGHGVTLFFYISTKEWADFVTVHGSSAGSGYRLLRVLRTTNFNLKNPQNSKNDLCL
jgi:hypothetical protein